MEFGDALLERAAGESAPVADLNASLWSDQDTFFRAWATAAKALEEATEGGPGARGTPPGPVRPVRRRT